MQQKTFPAFGYLVTQNEIDPTDVLNAAPFKNNVATFTQPPVWWWLYTRGHVRHVENTTGEVSDRYAGTCNFENGEPVGTWTATVLEPITTICVGLPNGEPTVLPDGVRFKSFHLPAGATTTVAQGTKLWIATGSLDVNGKQVPKYRQLEFSADRVVTAAAEEVYGVIFP